MQLKLISNSDYDIKFMISGYSKKIKLFSGKKLCLDVPKCKIITITPISISFSCSIFKKLIKCVISILFFLFYCVLFPYIEHESQPDLSELVLIDKIEIDTSSVLNEDTIEIQYHYKINSLFSSSKIEYKTSYSNIIDKGTVSVKPKFW